jgi:microcystin degradation protein MlrC
MARTRKLRVFAGGIVTETNTFSPFPTGWAGFRESGIFKDTSHRDGMLSGALRVYRTCAERDGFDFIESLAATAQPAGATLKSVYEALRDEMLDDLKNAMPVDIVTLVLHGAMVADGYDDCEGDILQRVRQIAPDAVIGSVLDPHCHLTEQMIDTADFLVLAKEYPHIDFDDRAREVYDLCIRAQRREIRPVAAMVDTAIIGHYPTFDPPMRDVVADLRATELKTGILSASIAHGFPWGDVADVGTRVLIYSDGNARGAAQEAERIAQQIYELRHEQAPKYPDIQTSLDRAQKLDGRVVLGDGADNPGGGAPGDSTYFLRALFDNQIEDAVIGTFFDPMVVALAFEAGIGARLSVRLGGKSGPSSGDPFDLDVEVRSLVEGHVQSGMEAGMVHQMGNSVWLHSAGIDIAVCSVRCQVFHPSVFSDLGIPMDNRRLTIVKSSNHYRAGFDGAADHIWHVATPGAVMNRFASLPYTKRDLAYFPQVEDPWAETGPRTARIFEKRSIRDTMKGSQ